MITGKGKGVGNPAQGEGGFEYCKCTKCDWKGKHIRGYPCIDHICPKCGGDLTGSN